VTGGDIKLVPLGPQHGDAMDALARDVDVDRFTRIPVPVPEGFGPRWVQRYVDGWAEDRNRGFAIEDAATGEFLGFAALVGLSLEEQEAEAGYLVPSRHRGRGIATRALRLLTEWAFAELPLERIELKIDTANVPSEVVAERCGYVKEGVLRSTYLKQGLRSDTAIWSRLRGDP
jgi:RimJ/RimL family protein N-acetyltransferase